MTNDIEYLFTCLLFSKVPFQVSFPFSIYLSFFFDYFVRSSSHILDMDSCFCYI